MLWTILKLLVLKHIFTDKFLIVHVKVIFIWNKQFPLITIQSCWVDVVYCNGMPESSPVQWLAEGEFAAMGRNQKSAEPLRPLKL